MRKSTREFCACNTMGAFTNPVVGASQTQPVRVSSVEYAPGTRVRYACSPPMFGVVVRRDGGSHWVAFPEHGELRCNTFDLKVLREGE